MTEKTFHETLESQSKQKPTDQERKIAETIATVISEEPLGYSNDAEWKKLENFADRILAKIMLMYGVLPRDND